MRHKLLPSSRHYSVLYALAVAALSVVVSLLLICAIFLRDEVPMDEGALGPGVLWIASCLFSAGAIVAVFRVREGWLCSEPRWLQVGLIPVLGLCLGAAALFSGALIVTLLLVLEAVRAA